MARRRNGTALFRLLCWILVLLKFKFSTADIIPIHLLCALEHYDYLNLTAVTWVLPLDQKRCLPILPVNSSIPPTDCNLQMSFCHKIPFSGACENSSVCQQSQRGLLSLGAYSESPFSSQDPLPDGADGFHSYFPIGSAYRTKANASCFLQTFMTFQCNHSAHWDVGSYKTVQAPMPKEMLYDDLNCQMHLTFEYAGACRRNDTKEHGIGVGSMLIIIFSITIFLYFVLGVMVNAVRGNSGAELIPHSQYWMSLPGLIKDGCLFVCFRRKRSGSDSYAQI